MRMICKRIAVVLLVVVLTAAFYACEKNPAPPGDDPDATPELTPRADIVDVTPVISGKDFKLVGLLIYTVDATSESVVNQTVMLAENTEITPALIIDYITEALKDESVKLSFDGIEYSNGRCIVDFDDSILSIAKASPDLENAVLDAIAQSVLDNVDGCMEIVYRLHGQRYSTANRTFDIDYVYMDN